MTIAKPQSRYVTGKDTPARQIITWLLDNPEEGLGPADMVIKFDLPTNRIGDVLHRAVEIGAITRAGRVYQLGNTALARIAIGDDGDAVRQPAALAAATAVAAMTAAATRARTSIDQEPGEAWNEAAARTYHADRAKARAKASAVTLADGQVVALEEVPYTAPRRVVHGGRIDPILDALAAARPAPGRTVRAALPEGVSPTAAAGALYRWHKARGHTTRVVEIVRTPSGAGTVTAALQRVPVTA